MAIDKYATHAAFRDSRFDPISIAQVESLKVGVSVLSEFEEAEDLYDWEIGMHGIILQIGREGEEGKWHSATYLPEVCAEQGWSKEVCLTSLAEKAGWRGELEGGKITRYQSRKEEMTFGEYLRWVHEG